MHLLRCFIVLFLPTSAVAQTSLPIITDADPAALRRQVREVCTALKARGMSAPDVAGDATPADVQKLLDPLCLVAVTINPESRVKAARGPARAELQTGRASVLLVKVHNDAGITHALTVTGPQLRGDGGWLDAQVQTVPAARRALSGQKLEYLLLVLTPHEAGKREATLQFDAGQGTQDLGYRAEVPVLFAVVKRAN